MISTKLEDLAERIAQLESGFTDLCVRVDMKGMGSKCEPKRGTCEVDDYGECNCHSSTAEITKALHAVQMENRIRELQSKMILTEGESLELDKLLSLKWGDCLCY